MGGLVCLFMSEEEEDKVIYEADGEPEGSPLGYWKWIGESGRWFRVRGWRLKKGTNADQKPA